MMDSESLSLADVHIMGQVVHHGAHRKSHAPRGGFLLLVLSNLVRWHVYVNLAYTARVFDIREAKIETERPNVKLGF